MIFQDLDLGEAISAEAEPRPTKGGGKHPPEAKSFGESSAEDLKLREMPPPRDELPLGNEGGRGGLGPREMEPPENRPFLWQWRCLFGNF